MRSDHRHLTAYQIGCEVGQSVVLVLRPPILNRHILALDVAGFTKALAECGQKACTIGKERPRAAEKPDHRHRRLLRARRERPGRRAAEQRDELAPFHVEHGDFLPYALLARRPGPPVGFSTCQPATAKPASPWGRPELF